MIFGISGGGYLALKMASFAPQRVSKAFVISSAGLVSLMLPGLGFLLGTIPAVLYPSQVTGRLFVRMVSGRKIKFNAAHERMAQGMALLFRHYRMLRAPGYLSDEELGRISAQVYLLMGAQDSTVSAMRTVERAQRLIPHVQSEIVPDAGHVLTMNRPDVVTARLVDFLAN